MSNISKLRLTVILIIIASLCIGSIWLLLPAPADFTGDQFYSPLGTPTTIVDLVLAIGGGILFLRALRNFKEHLKPAWRLAATAQISLGMLTVLFPIIEYYYLWPNVWWNMSSYLAFLVGSIFMYFAMRRFCRILDVNNWVTTVSLIGGVILLGWALHAFIPHPQTWDQFTERQYDAFELIPLIPIICYAAAAYMAFRIRVKVGAEYHRAFTWLTIGLATQAVACIAIGVLELVGYDNWYFNSRVYELPNILGDIAILGAAYYFNAIGMALPQRRKDAGQSANSVDIILYVAGLASDASKIDPYLDKVRIITASHNTSEQLNDEMRKAFLDAYTHIEDYLIHDERLRNFDAITLRATVVSRFNLTPDNSANTFWPRLDTKPHTRSS